MEDGFGVCIDGEEGSGGYGRMGWEKRTVNMS